MARTLTATLTGQVNYTYKKTRTIADTQESKTVSQETSYTNGPGEDQAEIIYAEQVTVTSGSPNQDFDLYGALLDIFGDTLNFEYAKGLLFRNLSAVAGDDIYVGSLGVANALTGPWGGDANAKNTVRAGGALLLDAPLDGYNIETDKQIIRVQYQGTSGSINVQVVILGNSGDLESSSSSSSSTSSLSSSSESSSVSSSSSSASVSSSSSSASVSSSSSSYESSSSSSSSPSSSSQSSSSPSSSSSGGSSYSSSSGGSSASSESSSSSSASSISSQG